MRGDRKAMIDPQNWQNKAVHILLVEDDPADARLFRESLAEANTFKFELREVASMSAAESYMFVERYDVIVLDLFLPDSTGMESYDRIRASLPETPILVLTRLNHQAFGERLIEEGAQGYFVKDKTDYKDFIISIQAAFHQRKEISSADQMTTGEMI